MQKARGHPDVAIETPTACRPTVSCSISLPSKGFFSPFPHGTGSLSVIEEYLALPRGRGGFTQDFSCPVLLGSGAQEAVILFAYGAFTPYGRPFQDRSAKETVCNFPRALQNPLAPSRDTAQRTPAGLAFARFRLFPVRSPLLGESRLLSFPPGTKMVHFPGFTPRGLCIQPRGGAV